MSDGIKVDFAEIDRLTTRITSVNAFAGPLVPKVGALSTDGDLLASAILSPGTALAAEGAVINASAQLGITLGATEALVIITASIPKVYETAELALSVAVAAASAGIEIAKIGAVRFAATSGLLASDLWNISTVIGAAEQGATLTAALEAAVAVSRGQSVAVVWRSGVGGFWDGLSNGLQAGLGGLGDSYDGILGRVLADGQRFGLFDDGSVVMGKPDSISQDELDARAIQARGDSRAATGVDVRVDGEDRIVPTDVPSLFEGSKQIDGIGEKDLADIRVLSKHHADGSWSFVVQIPSTMNWSPAAGAPPNDLTSDLYALHGGNSALKDASFAALRKAMAEAKAPADSPVMVSGFSLGGITAATMAADSHGFNIQQLVTAGSPIANIPVPKNVNVLSFEAQGDPIPSLDGARNPDRPGWTTIQGAPAALKGESGSEYVDSGARHDADRYALMARDHPQQDEDIRSYLASNDSDDKEQITVQDHYATRH
jgi:hypothetical protein